MARGAKDRKEGNGGNNSETEQDKNKRGIGEGEKPINRGGVTSNIAPSEISKINLVEGPKAILIEIPEGGQAKNEVTPKPKKERKSKKEMTISQNEIAGLISGCFSLASLKGGEHWQVSEDEAMQVAKPLENILKKLDLLEKVSNASDGAMLIFAVASITLPRIIITKSIISEKKKSITNQLKGGGAIGNAESREKQETSDSKPSTEDIERIKETQSLNSKLISPLYQTNAQ